MSADAGLFNAGAGSFNAEAQRTQRKQVRGLPRINFFDSSSANLCVLCVSAFNAVLPRHKS